MGAASVSMNTGHPSLPQIANLAKGSLLLGKYTCSIVLFFVTIIGRSNKGKMIGDISFTISLVRHYVFRNVCTILHGFHVIQVEAKQPSIEIFARMEQTGKDTR
jgi:hypothetical protein